MDGATLDTDKLVKPYTNDNDSEYKANIWFANAGYRFDHNNFFKAEYAKNTKADNYDDAYSFEYDYKGAQQQNKGSWGMYLAYRNASASTQLRGRRTAMVSMAARRAGKSARATRCSRTYSSSPSTSTARTSQLTKMPRSSSAVSMYSSDTGFL